MQDWTDPTDFGKEGWWAKDPEGAWQPDPVANETFGYNPGGWAASLPDPSNGVMSAQDQLIQAMIANGKAANTTAAAQLLQKQQEAKAQQAYLQQALKANAEQTIYAQQMGDAQFLDSLNDSRVALERTLAQTEHTLKVTSTGWYTNPPAPTPWGATAPRPAPPTLAGALAAGGK